MKIRKLLFLLLFVIIGVLFIPNTVKAAVGDRFSINDIEYTILEENGSYNLVDVSRYHGNETKLIIPETVEYEGKTFEVKSIGYFDYLNIGYTDTVTSVTIPKTITHIIDEAFKGFDKLEEFIVSEDSENYNSIEGVLFNKEKTELIYYPRNKEGKTYVIPNSTEKIRRKAFENSMVTDIIIPNSMTEIGNAAFEGAKELVNVTIPSTVTKIEDNAFLRCTSLINITIPKSVTTISSSAFLDCTQLKEINVDENNQNYCSVDGVLFNKDKTEILRYPVNKEETSYQIPNSVIAIGNDVFRNCKSLKRITIPNSVKTIKGSSFDSCESLTTLSIPASVTTIEDYAFAWCYNLKSIIIPDSVTSMGDRTFFFGAERIPITIYSEEGSYAEQYAKQHNMSYKATTIYSIDYDLTNVLSDGEFYISPEVGDYAIILTANKGYKLPKNIIVKIGGIDLSGNDYDYNYKTGALTIKSDDINGNIEIAAIGDKIYKVSFDANDGKFSTGNNILIFEDVENCDFNNIEIPTRSGYKFLGYYTEKVGGEPIDNIMNSEEGINKDMIFYVQWEEVTEKTPVNTDTILENTQIDNNNINNVNNPQTGDNISLFIFMLVISVIGIITTTKFKEH